MRVTKIFTSIENVTMAVLTVLLVGAYILVF